jgi:hypothetical protein
MRVVGILIALELLVWFAYWGWSILLLTPLCALIAVGRPAAAGKLYPDFHEQRGRFRRAVRSDFSVWRSVRNIGEFAPSGDWS